ncbi:TolC family protein [Membranihabitans marinus]
MQILCFCFLSAYIYAQGTLSLAQAITLAQHKGIVAAQGQKTAAVADLNLELVYAQLKPQVRMDAQIPNIYRSSAAITQPDGSIQFQPISQDNSIINIRGSKRFLSSNTSVYAQMSNQRFHDFHQGFTSYNVIPITLGIEQGVHQFNSLKWDEKIAKLDRKIANIELNVNREKIAAEVTQAYFELLRAQVNREIAQSNKANNEILYELAEERYRLGKISKSELLQLQLGLNSAVQSELSAYRSVLEANANLKTELNHELSSDEIIQVSPPTIDESLYINGLQAAELAWLHRPEAKEMEKLLLQAQRAIDLADKSNGWQASFRANLGYVGSGINLSNAYSDPQIEALIQIGISIPIVDGGFRRKSIEIAKLESDFIKRQNDYDEAVFKQKIRQLVEQINQLQNEVQLAHTSYSIARERYNIVNQRFVLNDISITDLTLAFSERDQAWRNYIDILQAYWVNYYIIRQLTLFDFTTDNTINQ